MPVEPNDADRLFGRCPLKSRHGSQRTVAVAGENERKSGPAACFGHSLGKVPMKLESGSDLGWKGQIVLDDVNQHLRRHWMQPIE